MTFTLPDGRFAIVWVVLTAIFSLHVLVTMAPPLLHFWVRLAVGITTHSSLTSITSARWLIVVLLVVSTVIVLILVISGVGNVLLVVLVMMLGRILLITA